MLLPGEVHGVMMAAWKAPSLFSPPRVPDVGDSMSNEGKDSTCLE